MTKEGRILALDDEPNNLLILQEILEGYDIKTARSGRECLALFQSFKPDVLLLDVMLEDMSGLEVCRRIRAMADSTRAKIIMVSGRTEIDDRLEGYEAGADDYVGKPFYDDELLAKVRVFLRLTYAEQGLAALTKNLEQEVRVRTEQLVKAEKLAFIGMKTAELIHNIQNPLTVINGYAMSLQKQFPDNKKLEKMKGAVINLKTQIRDYLSFNSDRVPDNQALDLNEVLRAEVEYIKADELKGRSIELEMALNPLPPVRGLAVHFAHSFGNIIKNAVDAMYGCPTQVLKIRSSFQNDCIRIEFQDSGTGIPDHVRAKIFEPLFTTKAHADDPNAPQGTGLGLASCKRMMNATGGTIAIGASNAQGTTFVVELKVEAVAEAKPAA